MYALTYASMYIRMYFVLLDQGPLPGLTLFYIRPAEGADMTSSLFSH